jgi:hypothetical protein
MLVRGAAVLATSALHAHAIAVASLKASSAGPFSEPFDDFYVFDPYDDRWSPSASPDGPADVRWRPPPRDGEWPFIGPHEGNRRGWENRLLIVPGKKFAFCYIEKNACTQFNRLVNALNGMSSMDKIPFWKSNSEGKFKYYFKDELHPISEENGWKMAIFLREPAERFLSAWLSKCDAWEYGGIDCLGPRVTDLPESKKVELFEKTVLELLPQYMDRMRVDGSYNAHYDPQNIFCGGRRLEEYDFVGELSGSPEHIQEQVVDMLKRDAGMEESDPLMDLPRKLFPSHSTAGHGTGSTNLMSLFYRNATIYDKVKEFYAEDYRWLSSRR